MLNKEFINMKVGIISTVGVPACYGGYETLAENLVSRKLDSRLVYQVYCSAPSYEFKRKEYNKAFLVYFPFKANGWQGIIYDSLSMVHAFCTCDIILSLGTVGCFLLPVLKPFFRKKILVNFDGLDNKRSKWGPFSGGIIALARLFAAKFADIAIADNEGIQSYLQETYQINSALIEYGGDNAIRIFDKIRLDNYSITKGEYLFTVARIEPENNISMILQAVSRLPNQILVIVGNWNNSHFGRELRKKYQSYSNIKMFDPIYDSERINLLRSNCKLYIHGHSAGGTNPSLVEAMNLNLPIVAFSVSYNVLTTENKALYFDSAESLASIISNTSLEKLKNIGSSMGEIAKRRYTWSRICLEYEQIILGSGL